MAVEEVSVPPCFSTIIPRPCFRTQEGGYPREIPNDECKIREKAWRGMG